MASKPGESPDDRPAIYMLAYDEGIRVLEDQARTLEQLRVRMALLLGTATTASAFLAGVVAKAHQDDQDAWYWIGVTLGSVLYAAVLLRVAQALRPKYIWRFNMSPRTIVEGYADHDIPATLAETHRGFALINDENIVHNEKTLSRIRVWLDQALTFMIAEIALWALLVAKVG